jgi:small nuclear ribonucleoprotein (snRNP)-like protein
MGWFSPKSVINKSVRRQFAVTLVDNGGTFSGVLTDFDDQVWVFEQCTTSKGEEIAGRVFIDRINVAYLQEM